MPDQTYASPVTPPRITPQDAQQTVEPDQATGVPTQAVEVDKKDVITELGAPSACGG